MDKYSRIGILVTGDELVNGDITDRNCQQISQILVDNGFSMGQHLCSGDDLDTLKDSFLFLLERHHIVITTGGLGPTSDDKTRFAISDIIQRPLLFNPDSWQRVTERLQSFSLPIHESNRQQALFPEGSTPLPNEKGTADGCKIAYQEKLIFMLPGPPHECLPIFKKHVLPSIKKRIAIAPTFYKKWRLFGVSEGEIAATIDDALKDIPCSTGYRTDYPYLECKIRAEEKQNIEKILKPLLDPYLLSDEYLPASKLLRHTLKNLKAPMIIDDQATGGKLQTQLLRPYNRNNLQFKPLSLSHNDCLAIEIQGLNELWNQTSPPCHTQLTLHFHQQGENFTQTHTLPFRHKKIIDYAVELVCHKITQFLV